MILKCIDWKGFVLDGLDASLFVSRVLCGDQTIAEPFDRLMVRMEQCGSGTERVVQRAGGGHRNLHLFHPVTPSDVLVQGPSEVDIEKLKSPADTQNGFSCTDKLADGVKLKTVPGRRDISRSSVFFMV